MFYQPKRDVSNNKRYTINRMKIVGCCVYVVMFLLIICVQLGLVSLPAEGCQAGRGQESEGSDCVRHKALKSVRWRGVQCRLLVFTAQRWCNIKLKIERCPLRTCVYAYSSVCSLLSFKCSVFLLGVFSTFNFMWS